MSTPTSGPGTSSSTRSGAESGPAPRGRLARSPLEGTLLTGGVLALLIELVLRQADPLEGFTFGGALAGIVGQLPVTVPAAIAVSAAATFDLAAGAVLLRVARRSPFQTWAEVLLAGFVGAILLDAVLAFVLGGLGLFRPLALVALLVLACLAAVGARPLVVARVRLARPRLARMLIVGLVWCGPLLVALASPVVPAGDVLPNHVAPAEHLRVFGSIASLASYPSPIYGPSRLFLGYSALMATLATITGLPAALTVAAFTGPLLVVSAVAIRRLAGVAFGREASFWVLLAFPLAFTFVRLPDVRDSVVALPLAAVALAQLLRPDRASGRPDEVTRRPDWVLAAALTAAILVHPLVGVLAAGSIVLITASDPGRFAGRAVPALLAAAVAALPQLAVMLGLAPAPAWGALAFGLGALAAVVAARVVGAVDWSRIGAGPATAVTIVVAGLAVAVVIVLRPAAAGAAWRSVNPAFPILFGAAGLVVVLAASGLVPAARGGPRLLFASLASGALALVVVAAVPDSSLLGQSLQYEVPKAVGYWVPWACVPAAAGLMAAVARRRASSLAGQGPGGAIAAAFLAVVLLSIGAPAADSAQASHAVVDDLAHDLRIAELGYWQSDPDPRLVVGSAGAAVLGFLRAEIAAGRLGADSQLLHVAASYQESASLPIADFTGIDETTVSADATTNIFTAGGRIHPLADLPVELRAGFACVVLEPAGLPASIRAAIVTAGYRSIFANARAEVFAAAP